MVKKEIHALFDNLYPCIRCATSTELCSFINVLQFFFVPPQLLLNSGSQADVNKIGSGGLSPLQLAAQSDHAKLCKLLVSKKFNDDI